MRAIFDASPVGIVSLEIENDSYEIYDCNFAYCHMNGYAREELLGQKIGIFDCAREKARVVGLDLIDSAEPLSFIFPTEFEVGGTFTNPTAWHKRKDGIIIAIEYASTVILINGKKMILGIDRDITLRRREEHLDYDRNRVLELIATGADVKQSLVSLEALVEGQLVGITCAFIVVKTLEVESRASPHSPDEYSSRADAATQTFWNASTEHGQTIFEKVELEKSVLLQRAVSYPNDFPLLIHLDPTGAARLRKNNEEGAEDVLFAALGNAKRCWLKPVIGSHGVLGILVLWSDEAAVDSKEGDDVQSMSVTFEDRFGKVVNIALRLAAIAIEQHTMSQRLEFQAERDLLTGLPNRFLFEDRLAHALSRAKRKNERLALLFLDLDGFKTVNDRWGHHCGDCVLQEVALRVQSCVRASDTLARLGGDEFTLILSDIQNDGDAEKVAKKISAALSQPFLVENQQTQITASIGIAFAPDDGDNLRKLMRNADSAMYRVKESGKNRYEIYEETRAG